MEDLNLICVQNNVLKIYIATQKGLEHLNDVRINGQIAVLKTLKLPWVYFFPIFFCL